MPVLKRRPGRPKGSRNADSRAYVRMTSGEREYLERACAEQDKGRPGSRTSVSGLLLAGGLRAASAILGKIAT